MTKYGVPDGGLKSACYDWAETGGEKSTFDGSREITIGSASARRRR